MSKKINTKPVDLIGKLKVNTETKKPLVEKEKYTMWQQQFINMFGENDIDVYLRDLNNVFRMATIRGKDCDIDNDDKDSLTSLDIVIFHLQKIKNEFTQTK